MTPEQKLKLLDRNMAFCLVPLYLNVIICLVDSMRGTIRYEWIPAFLGGIGTWWLYRSFRNRLILFEVRRQFRNT